MPLDAAQLDAVNHQGEGLRVVLARVGDRWQHAIERVIPSQSTTLYQSIEGSARDDWPPSPPFQELSQETLPDGRDVLFLVGRAGTSHWSASIEAASDPPQLIFDIACRHTHAPQQLGSAYQVVAAGAQIEALLGAVSAATVTPAQISTRLPGTTRWKYRFQ